MAGPGHSQRRGSGSIGGADDVIVCPGRTQWIRRNHGIRLSSNFAQLRAVATAGSIAWLLVHSSAALLLLGCGTNQTPLSEANQRFLEALDLVSKGKMDEAMTSLNASIVAEPTVWAYRERAKLFGQQGNEKAALEDCRAALALAPEDPDILWLQAEFAKPKAERFQGRFKSPPSDNKYADNIELRRSSPIRRITGDIPWRCSGHSQLFCR